MKIFHRRVRPHFHGDIIHDRLTISDKTFITIGNCLHRWDSVPISVYETKARLINALVHLLDEFHPVIVTSEKYAEGWDVTIDLNVVTLKIMEESIDDATRETSVRDEFIREYFDDGIDGNNQS